MKQTILHSLDALLFAGIAYGASWWLINMLLLTILTDELNSAIISGILALFIALITFVITFRSARKKAIERAQRNL